MSPYQCTCVKHHALDDIDNNSNTIAEAKGGSDLVREVHVAGSVYDVDKEGLAATIGEHQRHGFGLDRNSARFFVEASISKANLKSITYEEERNGRISIRRSGEHS